MKSPKLFMKITNDDRNFTLFLISKYFFQKETTKSENKKQIFRICFEISRNTTKKVKYNFKND